MDYKKKLNRERLVFSSRTTENFYFLSRRQQLISREKTTFWEKTTWLNYRKFVSNIFFRSFFADDKQDAEENN